LLASLGSQSHSEHLTAELDSLLAPFFSVPAQYQQGTAPSQARHRALLAQF
jgi:hypothetical protein